MKIRRLFDNVEIKLICLLLAIVVWLYANYPKGGETIEEITVKFRDVPIELSGSQKQWKADPSTISLEIKCPTAEIEAGNLRAVVRLTRENEEERRVILTAENTELPEGLIFVKAKPDEIQIE